jgi:hypothetical protein
MDWKLGLFLLQIWIIELLVLYALFRSVPFSANCFYGSRWHYMPLSSLFRNYKCICNYHDRSVVLTSVWSVYTKLSPASISIIYEIVMDLKVWEEGDQIEPIVFRSSYILYWIQQTHLHLHNIICIFYTLTVFKTVRILLYNSYY